MPVCRGRELPDGQYSPKNKCTVNQTRHSTHNPKAEELRIHANSKFEQIVLKLPNSVTLVPATLFPFMQALKYIQNAE